MLDVNDRVCVNNRKELFTNGIINNQFDNFKRAVFGDAEFVRWSDTRGSGRE